jgi:protein-tyrosine phosphatase
VNDRFHPLNYRDVGDALSLWLDPSPIPRGRLLRGGKLDAMTSAADLGNPHTILNLRRGQDPQHLAAITSLHVPAANNVENYDTGRRDVRTWLARALAVLASPATEWPVYVHCTSGRDRTGIVVGAALLLCDIPRSVILEEFLLSDGAERVAIERALDGIAGHEVSLGVDRGHLRANLLGEAGRKP